METSKFDIANYMDGKEMIIETGLSRPSLYKALSDEAKPQFANNNENFETIGGQIQVNPMPD